MLGEVADFPPQKLKKTRKHWLRKVFTAAAIAVSAPIVALHVAGGLSTAFPDLVSDPIEEYLEEQNIDDGFMQRIEGDNIRVYDKDAFLTPFHLAYRYMQLNATFIERNPELLASEKALRTLWEATGGLVVNYWDADEFIDISRRRSSAAAAVFTAHDNQDYFLVPPERVSAKRFVSEFTGIPMSHLRSFTEEDSRLFFEYVVKHEVAHTDFRTEFAADWFSVDVLDQENPDADMTRRIMYLRTLNTFGSFLHVDHTHATMLDLQNVENGEPVEILESLQTTLNMYSYLLANTVEPYLQTPHQYYIVVYQILREELEAGGFDEAPDLKNLAELYLEATEYFVPNIKEIAGIEQGLTTGSGFDFKLRP